MHDDKFRHDDTDNNDRDKRSTLCIVDTSEVLTCEELQELKRIAAMSKSAKWFVALIIGFVGLFGFDKILGWIGHLAK